MPKKSTKPAIKFGKPTKAVRRNAPKATKSGTVSHIENQCPDAENESPSATLRIYAMGPGIGESLVLHLPCGGWGVVDFYHTGKGGTLDFLRKMKVKRLKFLCLTHPHEDHYRGGAKLLDHFHGKIDRLWLFPGITSKDFVNLAVAARVRHKYVGDSRAEEMANDYLALLKGLIRERELLDADKYRRIIASPQSEALLAEAQYRIAARGPTSLAVDRFLEHLAPIVIKAGPMLLSEEGGELINSISIVLEITFGEASIFLLGDAQGRNIALDPLKKRFFTVVKLAHHGSDNGLGAQVLTLDKGPHFNHGLVTPYLRSGLPRDNMMRQYELGCVSLVHTNPQGCSGPRRSLAYGMNARVSNLEVDWTGLEVSITGAVRPLSEESGGSRAL